MQNYHEVLKMMRKTVRHIVLEFECGEEVPYKDFHAIATAKADEVLESLGQGGLIGGVVYFIAKKG